MATEQKSDQMKWRVTFKLPYPEQIYLIQKDTLPTNQEIAERKVWFKVQKKSIQGVRFVTCQFHMEDYSFKERDGREQERVTQLEIQELTFRDCTFHGTFLGGIAYRGCRFTDCAFHKCDFGSSKFIECTFSNCVFDKCSAWNTLFTRTLIDPAAFFAGLSFPVENYLGLPPKVVAADRVKHAETQLFIADQMLVSLSATNDSDFFDSAIYYSKYHDFWLRFGRLWDRARYARLHPAQTHRYRVWVWDASMALFQGVNLILTRGGTSFIRLLLWFLVTNGAVFPFLVFPFINYEYQDTIRASQDVTYLDRVMEGVELFLAFGYTNFKSHGLGSHLAIALYTLTGIMWYAFLIPVLLRRVYK